VRRKCEKCGSLGFVEFTCHKCSFAKVSKQDIIK